MNMFNMYFLKAAFLLLFFPFFAHAQLQVKPIIDTTAINSWQSVGLGGISNDGKYVSYTEKNNAKPGALTLIFKQTNGGWVKRIPDVTFTSMTGDSKFGVYKRKTDTLEIVELGTSKITSIANVSNFSISDSKNGHWITYSLRNQPRLYLLNLQSNAKRVFNNTKRYFFIPEREQMLFVNDINGEEVLVLFNLSTYTEEVLWKGVEINDPIFDIINNQFAMLAKAKKTDRDYVLLNFNAKKNNSTFEVKTYFDDINKELAVTSLSKYSTDGRHLFVQIKEKNGDIPLAALNSNLMIWSYADKKLPTQKINEGLSKTSFPAVINLSSEKITPIGTNQEYILAYTSNAVLIGNSFTDFGLGEERWWSGKDSIRFSVINLHTAKKVSFNTLGYLSPSGRLYIYFDKTTNHFFCYDIKTNITKRISAGIITNWMNPFVTDRSKIARGVAKWFENETAVLIYDANDIWKIDLKGEDQPINITNFYGVKNNIVFDCLDENGTVADKETAINLTAFSILTKDNGFFRVSLSKSQDPEKLFFGPYIFCAKNVGRSSYQPVKAKYAEIYLVRRESATQSPNYFVTTDFKSFNQLSDVAPEKRYNWYTSELHAWKSLDGNMLQGILYKPEDFDKTKKYPLIIHYYEKKSDGLNTFFEPAFSNGAINIPQFVSNGYLVFTPDMDLPFGDPMQGTYNSVVSAATYLSGLPFVDDKKLGIQGYSFGGWETNYLVTQTQLFAAAAETAGATNLISLFGSLRNGGVNQGYLQYGQGKMNSTPYDSLNNYIKNSPIFYADRVSTPLLMMHNPGDQAVPQAQGIEFFTSLRRLKKRAWMLSYADSGHGVYGKSAIDFNIKLMEFFDYYLKDSPKPNWMTFRKEDEPNQLNQGATHSK